MILLFYKRAAIKYKEYISRHLIEELRGTPIDTLDINSIIMWEIKDIYESGNIKADRSLQKQK